MEMANSAFMVVFVVVAVVSDGNGGVDGITIIVKAALI